MSNEKVGRIVYSDGKMYSREHQGIDLPYDFMTKEEREKLNGEVTTYFIKEDENGTTTKFK